MTTPPTADMTVLYARVLATPDDDVLRGAYADALDESAGTVQCRRCIGTGSHALNPYELAQRYGVGTATKILDAAVCGVCQGAGTEPDGRADRAALIRCQVELAGIPTYPRLGRSPPVGIPVTNVGVHRDDRAYVPSNLVDRYRELVRLEQKLLSPYLSTPLRAGLYDTSHVGDPRWGWVDAPPGYAAGGSTRRMYGRERWHGCWLPPNGDLPFESRLEVVCLNFVRGMVGEVGTTVRSWCAAAGELLARHPVGEVTLLPNVSTVMGMPSQFTLTTIAGAMDLPDGRVYEFVNLLVSDGRSNARDVLRHRWPPVHRWHFVRSDDSVDRDPG